MISRRGGVLSSVPSLSIKSRNDRKGYQSDLMGLHIRRGGSFLYNGCYFLADRQRELNALLYATLTMDN